LAQGVHPPAPADPEAAATDYESQVQGTVDVSCSAPCKGADLWQTELTAVHGGPHGPGAVSATQPLKNRFSSRYSVTPDARSRAGVYLFCEEHFAGALKNVEGRYPRSGRE